MWRPPFDHDRAFRWGKWIMPSGKVALYHRGLGREYEVPLEECETHEGALVWVQHVAEKSWATQEDIDDLRWALREITGWRLPHVPKAQIAAVVEELLGRR